MPGLPRERLRQAAVLMAGLLTFAIIAGSASVVMLQGRPAGARGKPVEPDSIAMTARLDRYSYDLEDSKTVLITVRGTGLTYLVKDENTALADANVQFEIPRPGISGKMNPQSPGEYAYTLEEQVRIHSPVPFLQTRNWQVRDLRIEVDGQDETHRLSMTEKTASALNFARKDVKGAGLDVFSSPRTYEIQTRTRVSFRVLKADGSPAANLSAVVEFPSRNYRETFATDQDGWVRIDRTEDLKLTIQGGKMVEIQGPIFIELPEDEETLFWWAEPNERCDMDWRPQQKRLAVEPGKTARFGFELVNRGNRPDTYTFRAAGVPGHWIEIEYDELFLLPFFGQVVYVNVTPDRTADTKAGTRRIEVTAVSSCKEMTATSDAKVINFHEADVDIVGANSGPGPKVAADLRQQARQARSDETLSVIVRSGGTLPPDARAEVEALGGKVSREFSLIHGMSVLIPAEKLEKLSDLPWVGRVDQNHTVKALLSGSVPATGAPKMWEMGYDGTGVIVAVIDTGM